MNQKNQIWAQYGGKFYLEYPSVEHQKLRNGIYTVKVDQKGNFYLEKVADEYVFDYKLYGLESKLINRVEKTFDNTTGNLGILLNGVKGTGKTVTCKQISNNINQPTIVVSQPYDGVQYFLNSIPQDITIFVDEYEKIFGKSKELLTIMDGAMNSEFRRLFLLTTNNLYIEDNLKQRPSRLRYMKEFKDLSAKIVEEIIDDMLENDEFRSECISFMTSLSLITVDIVKQIINEVNIHNESPFEFEDVFNVSKIENKYNIFEVSPSGDEELIFENTDLYPRPEYNSEAEDYHIEIKGKAIGSISKVMGTNLIEVKVMGYDKDDDYVEIERIVLKVEKTYGVHSHYSYKDGVNVNSSRLSSKGSRLLESNKKSGTKKPSTKKLGGSIPDVSISRSEILPMTTKKLWD